MITKLILSNNGFEDVSRSTEDIDGNWIGEAPTMDSMIKIGDMYIRGVIADEIIAGKLCVLPGYYIFRRAKDIIDVYSLSHCVDVKSASIFDICKLKGNEINTFDEFYHRKNDVEHAYSKLGNEFKDCLCTS